MNYQKHNAAKEDLEARESESNKFLEVCDCCGDIFPLRLMEVVDKQILCEKCREIIN